MTTTANNNERKEFVNKIGFSGSFYKFLGEDIQEIEKRRKCKLKIEGKDRVYKQFPEKECEVLENLYQLGYASKVQKELRDKARKEEQKEKELREIEEERNKALAKAQKEYEVKKAVVSFGISWDNVTLYDHRNELCFNWLDCCKKVPSDLINELVCSNTLPEGIEVTNLDKGRE